MKNYVKAIIGAAFLMAAVVFIPAVSDAAAAPTNLRQTGASRSSVDIVWDAVLDADEYCVQWSNDGVTWGTKYDTAYNPKDTTYGLSAGSTYYVRVASYDENGTWLDETDDIITWSKPIQVVTSPDAGNITSLTCTAATTNSLTYNWNPAIGATSYQIYDYWNDMLLGTTTDTTFTRTNLIPGTSYGIKVIPIKTSATGFAAATNYAYLTGVYTNKSAPGTPSASNFTIAYASATSGSVSFRAADTNKVADGYDVEVRKVKGGKVVKTVSASDNISTSYVTFGKNTPYKYRVRFYVSQNGTKVYGGWSGYRYFCVQKVNGKKHYRLSSKYCTIKFTWGKVSGATGYTVYMSTNKDGKYKKVKSLGKNAKGVTLTKYGKSKLSRYKTYYVKIVPKYKDGKKTVTTNDAQIVYYNY